MRAGKEHSPGRGWGAGVSGVAGARPERAAGSVVTDEVGPVGTMGVRLIWQLESPVAAGEEVSLEWGKWRLGGAEAVHI